MDAPSRFRALRNRWAAPKNKAPSRRGFIWKQGDCGQASFHAEAEGVTLDFSDSNWIYYDFDWTNQ